MKISPLFFCILFIGCNGPVKNGTVSQTSESEALRSEEHCFQLLQGTQNQDTTNVTLHIHGSSVSGDLNAFPFEKDARRGQLTGTIKNDRITAMWHYVQEGITDSMRMDFKLEGNILLQKGLSIDPQTGRQYTNDTSGYSVKYLKVACKD